MRGVKLTVPARVQRFSPIAALVDLIRDWIGRFVAVQGVDRAMAIGAQAYTALFPLLIVYIFSQRWVISGVTRGSIK